MFQFSVRLAAALALLYPCAVRGAEVPVDFSGYDRGCGVVIESAGDNLTATWQMAEGEDATGRVALRLAGGPLVRQIALSRGGEGGHRPLISDVDPAVFLTVGSRKSPGGKPDDQKWQVFFDKPANRPHETYLSRLEPEGAKVTSRGRSASIELPGLSAGGFSGSLVFHFYAGCRLIQVEAVLATEEDDRAIIYDAGLLGKASAFHKFEWIDTEGRRQTLAADSVGGDRPIACRHRVIVAAGEAGAVACFSPPHQYHFPRDWTDNLQYVWCGPGHREKSERFGFGVKQDKAGGGAFVPWFNAPPGEQHRMGVFYLLAEEGADQAFAETLRFTHGDRFPDLPGYKTFTSHYHMAISVAALERDRRGQLPGTPDYAAMFKEMNVNMVHLGEFHGDGHQKGAGQLRLPELAAMFAECRRLSDEDLLLIPGEEINTYLGLQFEGKHPGHWMSVFPRPVYWTMAPDDDRPFVEEHAEYGRVYHVGDRGEMIRLLKEENGLVWAAHPRIKASSWTPDIFREEDFFVAPFWLGGAWKAMPADLSRDRLGERVLDLMDDMANWGHKKYVLGEVDVFKLEHTHELYGHMNINYVEMDRVPGFDEGWQSVLDVLSAGKFFVSTGEVLIPSFSVGGQKSGDTLKLAGNAVPEVRASLRWTFPLAFAEVISGDGEKVYRDRIDLSDSGPFGARELAHHVDLSGRRWVRLEVWDAAKNGAFTQPVWLVP